jgi:hypothetical protein
MQETLQQLLARLRHELDRAEHGHVDRAALSKLAGEVERRLDPDQDDDDEGLGDELRDGVRRFEVSHPDLASVIGRAADALGGIGL